MIAILQLLFRVIDADLVGYDCSKHVRSPSQSRRVSKLIFIMRVYAVVDCNTAKAIVQHSHTMCKREMFYRPL